MAQQIEGIGRDDVEREKNSLRAITHTAANNLATSKAARSRAQCSSTTSDAAYKATTPYSEAILNRVSPWSS